MRFFDDSSEEKIAASSFEEGGYFFGGVFPLLGVLILSGLLAWFSIAAPRGDSEPSARAAAQPLAPLFTSEVLRWEPQIVEWAAHAGVDPNLAATVMQIESCGNPYARSRAGAMGLFQVMPYHFLPGENPYLPETNARRGLAYLKKALDVSAGNPRLALAGYNGGISVISRPSALWTEETRRYVYWGTGIYEDARQHRAQSARLEEWLRAGGASLCAAVR